MSMTSAAIGILQREWRTGNPAGCGYYLATWMRGRDRLVSELWYADDTWYRNRAYLDRAEQSEVFNVVGWMPMPAPMQGEQ